MSKKIKVTVPCPVCGHDQAAKKPPLYSPLMQSLSELKAYVEDITNGQVDFEELTLDDIVRYIRQMEKHAKEGFWVYP